MGLALNLFSLFYVFVIAVTVIFLVVVPHQPDELEPTEDEAQNNTNHNGIGEKETEIEHER